MLTRQQMETAIKQGGSVRLPNGQYVTRLEDLPTDTALACGDVSRLEAARKSLQRDLARIQGELETNAQELDKARIAQKAKADADAAAAQSGQQVAQQSEAERLKKENEALRAELAKHGQRTAEQPKPEEPAESKEEEKPAEPSEEQQAIPRRRRPTQPEE